MEIWKDVPHYEGLYQVSNLGRIRNSRTGRILKIEVNTRGYCKTFLYDKNIKRKCLSVHRLVCMAFHKNPENLPQVNHKNMNKLDNRAENLEWCSSSYNLKHSYANGGREYNKKRILEVNCKAVWCCDMEGNKIKKYYSLSEASRQTGIDVSNISACCHGRIKSVGGYKWQIALEH